MNIKVAIVDDHQLIRAGLSNFLGQQSHIEIVAQYATTQSLLNGLNQKYIDVIILDLHLAEGNSDFIIPVIKSKFPDIKILFLSSNENIHNIKIILNNGADGYLLKTTDQNQLIAAIKNLMDPVIQKPIISREINNQLKNLAGKSNTTQHLTQRETEVLQLIAKEYTSQEIGQILNLSTRTVESYRLLLMQKLDVKNMVGMVKKAIIMGLVKD